MPLESCPDCTAQVSPNAVFCPHCGRPGTKAPLRINVEDFEMKFITMVIVLVKLIIAAIPALVIVFVLSIFAAGLFMAVTFPR